PYVPLSGGVIKALKVNWNGTPLDPTSLSGLDLRFPNWEGTKGTPRYWAPVSLTLLVIYPADTGIHASLVDAYSPAPILINGGDFLNLGSEEIHTLLSYALHVLAQSQGIEAIQR